MPYSTVVFSSLESPQMKWRQEERTIHEGRANILISAVEERNKKKTEGEEEKKNSKEEKETKVRNLLYL